MDGKTFQGKVSAEIGIYFKLHEQINFLNTLQIEDFTEKVATEFQRLRHLKVRIGTMDLKIAAIALANNAILYTRNAVDFSRVPGLGFRKLLPACRLMGTQAPTGCPAFSSNIGKRSRTSAAIRVLGNSSVICRPIRSASFQL